MAGNSQAQKYIKDNGRQSPAIAELKQALGTNGRQWPAIVELKKAFGTMAGNGR